MRRDAVGGLPAGVANLGVPSSDDHRAGKFGKDPVDPAPAGRRVAVSLDRELTVEPGEMMSHQTAAPLETTVFRARETVRAGEILDFTNISAPHETPEACEPVVDTDRLPIAESIDSISVYVRGRLPLTLSRPKFRP